ncbi:MAG: hypothetical protein V8R80_07065 [Eubacterium sp.]
MYAAICAQTMVIHFKVDAVINTGVAGNLSDKLGIKSVAIANQVVQHDMDLTPIGYQYGELGGLDLVTFRQMKTGRSRGTECEKYGIELSDWYDCDRRSVY